jgi:hypothetical protein
MKAIPKLFFLGTLFFLQNNLLAATRNEFISVEGQLLSFDNKYAVLKGRNKERIIIPKTALNRDDSYSLHVIRIYLKTQDYYSTFNVFKEKKFKKKN